MKRVLILELVLLSLFAGYSQAADTSCNTNLERDVTANLQACTDAELPMKESAQTELARVFYTDQASPPTSSQNVLCSQCHQNAVPSDPSKSAIFTRADHAG